MNCCCRRAEDIKGELHAKSHQFNFPYITSIIINDESEEGHMKRLSAVEFYRSYFAATQRVGSGWLARLTAGQRLRMLEDLMQWEVTAPTTDIPLPR
ncbi:glucose uptake inhibitor SgrT [Dryocola clanedunensis]